MQCEWISFTCVLFIHKNHIFQGVFFTSNYWEHSEKSDSPQIRAAGSGLFADVSTIEHPDRHQMEAERIEWFTEGQSFLRSCDWFGSPDAHPPLSPLPSANCLISVFLCVAGPASWLERGGRGAESYDRKKACASINRSILSRWFRLFRFLRHV
jgi:hypothetical protein